MVSRGPTWLDRAGCDRCHVGGVTHGTARATGICHTAQTGNRTGEGGSPVTQSAPLASGRSAEFNLGVLFVHGIGEQQQYSTLARLVAPCSVGCASGRRSAGTRPSTAGSLRRRWSTFLPWTRIPMARMAASSRCTPRWRLARARGGCWPRPGGRRRSPRPGSRSTSAGSCRCPRGWPPSRRWRRAAGSNAPTPPPACTTASRAGWSGGRCRGWPGWPVH